MTFSGSYDPQDVSFLLKPLQMSTTPFAVKEALLRSGERHYSEMIAPEPPPDFEYVALFERAFDLGRKRLASDLAALALALDKRFPDEIVLVSLARAGTPMGILLHRALSFLGRSSTHYSISIIRGRGIDENALDHILTRHEAGSVAFVDGWTGKGAISAELRSAIESYNRSRGTRLRAGLTVLSDLAGTAVLAASSDDYLIPFSILNGVVSGLVSRTILHPDYIGPTDFHGCVFQEELVPYDKSRWLIEAVSQEVLAAIVHPSSRAAAWPRRARQERWQRTQRCLKSVAHRYGVRHENDIKPGLGEATRALLRRSPRRLLIHGKPGPDLTHLLLLAARREVPVEVCGDLMFRAVALLHPTRVSL